MSLVHAGYVFFLGECFMASVHARTELNLQGNRSRFGRLEILRRLFVGYGSRAATNERISDLALL